MSPAEVHSMTNDQIVKMLVSLRPGDEAVAWLASVISNPVLVEGVNELQRRYAVRSGNAPCPTPAGQHPHARTVHVDPARWRSFWWRRRMTLLEVGPMVNRCDGWASVVASRGRAGLYVLDEIACELEMNLDDLIFEVGTDSERSRLAVCV